jgi:ABC-type phosphate/phosphonate transport system permease subunit
MNSLKIILTSILLAIIYGIIHDLITTQICIEYFTITHPKIIESQHPIALAFLWGTIATWWVGLIFGILIVFANSFGKSRSLHFKELFPLLLKFFVILFGFALLAGVIGYFLTEIKVIHLVDRLKNQLENVDESRFLAVGWAHGASYIIGSIGIIILSFKILSIRKKYMSRYLDI